MNSSLLPGRRGVNRTTGQRAALDTIAMCVPMYALLMTRPSASV